MFRENLFKNHETFIKKTVFLGEHIYTYYITNYTHMKVTHLSWPSPNMNLIREVCDSLSDSTTSLTSFVQNHRATGWLLRTRPLVRGGILSDSLVNYTWLKSKWGRDVSNTFPKAQSHIGQTYLYFLDFNPN